MSDLVYGYDKAGHRTMQTASDGTVTTWTYDATYQLTPEQRSGNDGFDISYVYDGAGNRTLKTEVAGATTGLTTNTYRIG